MRYSTSTVIAGSMAATPASKPAWNFWISSMFTPPMKPTWSVSVVRAAAAPTRNEPCSSANTRLARLGRSLAASSTMANVLSGQFSATAPDRLGVEEAHADDQVGAVVTQQLQELLAVLAALVGLQLLGLDAELLDGLVEAGGGGVVERLVPTTTEVVGQADREVAGLGGGVVGGASGVAAFLVGIAAVVTARGGEQHEGQQEPEQRPELAVSKHVFSPCHFRVPWRTVVRAKGNVAAHSLPHPGSA